MYIYLIVPKKNKAQYDIKANQTYTAISTYENEDAIKQFLLGGSQKYPNHVALKVWFDEKKSDVQINENIKNGTYNITFQKQSAIDLDVIEEININNSKNKTIKTTHNQRAAHSSIVGVIYSSLVSLVKNVASTLYAPIELVLSGLKIFANVFQHSKPILKRHFSSAKIYKMQRAARARARMHAHASQQLQPVLVPVIPAYPHQIFYYSPQQNHFVSQQTQTTQTVPVHPFNMNVAANQTNFTNYLPMSFFAPPHPSTYKKPTVVNSRYADFLQHVNEEPDYLNHIHSLTRK